MNASYTVRAIVPASRSWQVFGLGKVGCRRVSEAQVDLSGPVPGQRLVRPVGVELDAEGLGFSDQVEGVVDLLAVQPLVLQRLERALARRFGPATSRGCGRDAARVAW